MAHESLGVQALVRVSFTELEILGLNLLPGGINYQEMGQRGKGQHRQKPAEWDSKHLKEMGILDNLTCSLRNLYAGQEVTVRSEHETIDRFKIGKGV